MTKHPYDAIVVGARCAGSPTAMLLARRGYKVLVVDRATFPSDTVSTHLVHPPGFDALQRWAFSIAFAEQAARRFPSTCSTWAPSRSPERRGCLTSRRPTVHAARCSTRFWWTRLRGGRRATRGLRGRGQPIRTLFGQGARNGHVIGARRWPPIIHLTH